MKVYNVQCTMYNGADSLNRASYGHFELRTLSEKIFKHFQADLIPRLLISQVVNDSLVSNRSLISLRTMKLNYDIIGPKINEKPVNAL